MLAHPRHDAIRKSLAAYEMEGATIRTELADIDFQRKRITENPSIRLVFGTAVADRGPHRPDYYERPNDSYEVVPRPIVLTAPGLPAPSAVDTIGRSARAAVATDCAGASTIAYPGLKACLLMWLDQRETHAKRDLAAWAARDAVAEAVAFAAQDPA